MNNYQQPGDFPFSYQPQGWVCPKCRRVYSPYITICPNCIPNSDLTNIIKDSTINWEELMKQSYITTTDLNRNFNKKESN